MSKKPSYTRQLTAAFMRLRPQLKTVGRRMLGNADLAEDAIQDTFEKMWCRAAETEVKDSLVMTAVKNTCIDQLRQRRPTETLTEDFATERSEDTSDGGELYERVSRLIDRHLSPRDREILLMRDREGFEIDAIAARSGLSEANVRMVLSRARKAVREAYRELNKN